MRLKPVIQTAVELIASPKTSVMYEPIQVLGRNLPKSSEITLRTTLVNTENKFNFESINNYKTSEAGDFCTATSPTVQDSGYKGIHTSGPLWSMRPKAGSRTRLQMEKIDTELVYNLQLMDTDQNILAEESLTKVFMTPDIDRYDISSGNIHGALFIPRGPRKMKKKKAVITIFGGAMFKGAPEDISALLATEGFVTLALAFYGAKGQPRKYYIHLEQLEEAVDFLRAIEEVEDKRINLYGVSKGADVCLSLAAFLGEKIGGTVAVSSACESMPGPTYYKGIEVIRGTKHLLAKDKSFMPEVDFEQIKREPERMIPVEMAKGPILAIFGQDDKSFGFENPWIHMAQERAFHAGKMDFEILTYPGLGHLLDSPNCPVCTETTNPLVPWTIPYGGQVQEQSLAQIDAWKNIVDLYKNL